ncbi:MAG: polysaccharide biosynthesis/export family protein [Desulfomonilaceae bacterium]|nr:polysaccharide biosynthesis/export family protein [Desulfomonilaceae bacterium]
MAVFSWRNCPRYWIGAGIAILLLSGCVGLNPSPFRPSPGPEKAPQIYDLAEAFDVVCRNYRLGPADVVTILFQTQWSIPAGTYKLDTLDKIQIKFILDPSLNEEVVIRPDGMITIQAIGEMQAAGLTPEELAKKIESKFIKLNIFTKSETRGALKNYQLVTVHVMSFYEKVKQLVQSLTTLAGGQQSAVTVGPDGTIDLPLLSDRIVAAGQTIVDVENTVNRLYRSGPLKHVVASMALRSSNSRRVYVMGQVAAPGAYAIDQPITALHAIALAGGHLTDSADLTSVILVTKNIHGKPIGRRLDLKRIFDVGDMSAAILVKPYDVVYVPKTYIADIRLFMDQYVATAREAVQFVNLLGTGR